MTHQANAANTELVSYSFWFYFLFAEKHFLIACTPSSITRNLSVSSPQIIDEFLYNSPLLFSAVRISHPCVLILGSSTLFRVGRNLQPHHGHILWPAVWYPGGFLPSQKLPLLSHKRSIQKMSSCCKSVPSKSVTQEVSRGLYRGTKTCELWFLPLWFLKCAFSGNDQEDEWKKVLN